MSDNAEVQTGRSRHSENLSTAEELSLLVDAVQDYAIFVIGLEGEIRSWNRGAARIFGYTAEEAIGRNFDSFYPPEAVAAGKPARELEIAAGEGRVEDEGWRIRKDGQRFWVNTVITALRDDSGAMIGFAKITRNLTQRRETEERLRQSEEAFRLLVESVRDYAIFMLDPQGRVATWNLGAQRIKGYEPREIIGRHFSAFYPPEEIAAEKPAWELETAKERGAFEDEGWRVRKDGSRFWANVVITAVFDPNGTLRGFAKVTRDITERKQAEETALALMHQWEARLLAEDERRRAEASSRVAHEANRAKDEFLMTLSHELRTPMTAILGWARLLPGMAVDESMFREAIASIGRSAELQAKLIDDVLDLSRIVSGKLRLSLEKVDVARALTAALETVEPSAEAKGITIERSFSSDAGSVLGDPTRLQQVVWNLLSNAVKFTPRGGRIRMGARVTESKLKITISDTGEGIEPGFLQYIFEPFRQAENPSTRVHGGLGLGLSIVRYIVEAHGGTVAAESRGHGQGSTFTVTLPVASIAAARSLPPEGEKVMWREIAGNELAGCEILIVDDDREGRDMLRAVLRQAGANVAAAESAAHAFAELEKHRPDLIITDIAMPHVDGLALVRELQQRPQFEGVKVIALTAFPRAAVNLERSGFRAYLVKPIEPAELIEVAARVIREQ
jgi:PAS domain S-box-containing protein